MIKFLKELFGQENNKTNETSKESSKEEKEIKKVEEVEGNETIISEDTLDKDSPYLGKEKETSIPIIDDPSKREYNKPFRKSEDEENVVRIRQRPPKGTPKKVSEFISVAGITRQKDDALKVITSENFSMRLEKEPDNPYDKNAIKVFGDCEIDGEEKSFFLGYIPKEEAKKIVTYNKLEATVQVIYLPTEFKSIGLRLDIWSERNKK